MPANETCDICNDVATVRYDREAEYNDEYVPRYRHYCSECAVEALPVSDSSTNQSDS
jgi:hypothetical protein